MILHTNRLLMFKMTVEHPHILRISRHEYARHQYGKYQWHTHGHISELDRHDNSILAISPIRSTARNLPPPATARKLHYATPMDAPKSTYHLVGFALRHIPEAIVEMQIGARRSCFDHSTGCTAKGCVRFARFGNGKRAVQKVRDADTSSRR